MMRFSFVFSLAVTQILGITNRPDAGEVKLIKAINLEKLNSAGDEEDPAVTPDGSRLFFVRKGKKNLDILQGFRSGTSFGPGKPFLFDRGADVRSPFVHKGKLYFSTNEIPDKKFEDIKNFDLRWQTGTQAALPILGNINSEVDEMYPWVTPGGSEMYFSRRTKEGWKLFIAKGPIPGPIGQAKELGFPAGFHRATLSGAALTMYLQGPLENGRIGIFRSKRAKAGQAWSKPEPVRGLNHPEGKLGDLQPALSYDGLRLYFVSDRPGGQGGLDIWYVATSLLK